MKPIICGGCRKAKELGYPHELWTTRLLARHAREQGPAEGHGCLAKLAQGPLCNILNAQEIKPHKVRYHLECRSRSEKAVEGRPAERSRGSPAPALGRLQRGVGIPGWEKAWT